MYEIIAPKIEANTEDVVIKEWLKKEGDSVKKEEPLFLMETIKAVIEVPSECRGVLKKILVKEGESVPVLSVVAVIEEK